jgi:hypothetical protein
MIIMNYSEKLLVEVKYVRLDNAKINEQMI